MQNDENAVIGTRRERAERLRTAIASAANSHGLWWDAAKSRVMVQVNDAAIVVPPMRPNGQPPVLKQAIERKIDAFRADVVEACYRAKGNFGLFTRAAILNPDEEQLRAAHPLEVAGLLRLVQAAHTAPRSDLEDAVDEWLAARCELGAGFATSYRDAVALFEAEHPGFCRRALLRILRRKGLDYAKGPNGKRLLIGLRLQRQKAVRP